MSARAVRRGLAGAAMLLVVPALWAGSKTALSPAAEAAVLGLFPAGKIEQVGLEREGGVEYFEVAVREGQILREIEVTRDGAIGEIEGRVALDELPPGARARILSAVGSATPSAIERHEVRGTPQGGTFVPVNPPLVLYEAIWVGGGARREIVVTADGGVPPLTVAEDLDDGDGGEDDD